VETADRAYELGREYEQRYMGCGQCIVAALQDAFDVRDDGVFKAATGLAGGGGLSGDSGCGAYVGSIMMLSYLAGRPREDFEDRTGGAMRTFRLAQRLRDRFIEEYGSVRCHEIQHRILGRPYYLMDMDDFRKFDEAGGHTEKCPEVVGKAARWAAELIEEAGLVGT
jgi:C_GCAxxG_C_C family probable redox protein